MICHCEKYEAYSHRKGGMKGSRQSAHMRRTYSPLDVPTSSRVELHHDVDPAVLSSTKPQCLQERLNAPHLHRKCKTAPCVSPVAVLP